MDQSNSNLFADLNTLIHLLKLRQQNHLTLVDYIKKVSTNLDQDILLDEELKQHQRIKNNIQTKQDSIRRSFGKLYEKLNEHNRKLLNAEEEKLINKSVQRVVEIFQSSAQKFVVCQQIYDYEYKCFKECFLKLEGEKASIITLAERAEKYSGDLFADDERLLVKIIDVIQNGQKDTIRDIIEERYTMVRNKIQEQKIRVAKVKQDEMKFWKQRKREEEEEQKRISQKMKLAIETQKVLAVSRRKVTKFSDTVLTKLYQPMTEFCRTQFNQDMIFADENQHKQKLMKLLKQKNKLVQSQIFKFIEYSSKMEQRIKVIAPKFQKHGNSLPVKSSTIVHRVSSVRNNSPQPAKVSTNYSSIQTISQLPVINDIKNFKNARKISDQHYSPRQNKSKKPVMFINNISPSLKLSKHYEVTESKSIFETVKFSSEKRKENIVIEGLPHINLSDRISLDMARTKVIVCSRSIPKVIEFNLKTKKRSNASQMLIPFIQMGIPNKYSTKINKQPSEPTYNLKKLLKN